jgi:hypothetical protein
MSESSEDRNARLARAIDVWKHVVSVQMHFNDMGMKIRTLYFTIIAAAMGLIGVVQGKQIDIESLGIKIHVALVVILALVPISMLFYFLDRHWYHRLLQGAVAQCIEIENAYAAELPEIQLGQQISKASPVHFDGVWKHIFFFITDDRFTNKSMLHSDQKLEVLYKAVMWAALIGSIIYAVISGIEFRQRALLSWILEVFGWKS